MPFDPILAILLALNILWSGARLMRRAFAGLMDERDAELDERVCGVLARTVPGGGIEYRGLRHRQMGGTVFIDV